MSTSEEAITGALAAKLEPLGLIVEDVTLVPAGKRRLVRILVDRALSLEPGQRITSDGAPEPITLDEVTEATRVIDEELEASNVMGQQPYVLEVSSPGTDRPLTQPRHFARNVARLVTVTLTDGTKMTGRITAADADGIDITPEQGGKKAGARSDAEPTRLEHASITSAKVQVEFTRVGDDAAEGEDV